MVKKGTRGKLFRLGGMSYCKGRYAASEPGVSMLGDGGGRAAAPRGGSDPLPRGVPVGELQRAQAAVAKAQARIAELDGLDPVSWTA